MKRLHLTIKGDNIQRCGFRNFISQIADKLGISGQAAYIDHHLSIEIEGDEDKLTQFLEFCKIGPEGCVTKDIEITEMPVLGLSGFKVIHGVLSSALKTAS